MNKRGALTRKKPDGSGFTLALKESALLLSFNSAMYDDKESAPEGTSDKSTPQFNSRQRKEALELAAELGFTSAENKEREERKREVEGAVTRRRPNEDILDAILERKLQEVQAGEGPFPAPSSPSSPLDRATFPKLSLLKGGPITDLQAQTFPPRKKLLGSCLFTGQSAILFSPPGVGKSLFSLELARAVAEGRSLGEDLENELPPSPVLFLDFENSDRDAHPRLRTKSSEPALLHRYSFNEEGLWELKPGELAKRLFEEIDKIQEWGKFELVVLDNVSYIAQEEEGADVQQVAVEILKRIKPFKDKHGCTFLLVAHSTKKAEIPVKLQDLAGSANWARFVEALFTLNGPEGGKSEIGEEVRYIKTFKQRVKGKVFSGGASGVCGLEVVEGDGLTLKRRKDLDGNELNFRAPEATNEEGGLNGPTTRHLVRNLLDEGKSQAEVAKLLNLSSARVSQVKSHLIREEGWSPK